MEVSRIAVIRKLVRKEYKSVRPTAEQINLVIKKYGLNLYGSDGRRRTKEVIAKKLALALETLKSSSKL